MPPLSAAARLLGYAGLLPQLVAVLLIATRADPALGALAAFGYAGAILSFVGGIWWGLAMRAGREQPLLTMFAIAPSLTAFALLIAQLLGLPTNWGLVLIGSALALALLVDRRIIALGDAPPRWMELRAPLSLGLAALTILAGVLAPPVVMLSYSN